MVVPPSKVLVLARSVLNIHNYLFNYLFIYILLAKNLRMFVIEGGKGNERAAGIDPAACGVFRGTGLWPLWQMGFIGFFPMRLSFSKPIDNNLKYLYSDRARENNEVQGSRCQVPVAKYVNATVVLESQHIEGFPWGQVT